MGHYSLAHRPKLLGPWAQNAARALRALLDKEEGREVIPVFVYRGMSGVAHATALSLEWERRYKGDRARHGMVYVRKPGESAHSSGPQTTVPCFSNLKLALVFVDDFVLSGATRTAVLKAALKREAGLVQRAALLKGAIYTCVGYMDDITVKVYSRTPEELGVKFP